MEPLIQKKTHLAVEIIHLMLVYFARQEHLINLQTFMLQPTDNKNLYTNTET